MSETTPTEAAAAAPVIDPEKIHLVSEHKLPRALTACCWDPQNRFVFVGSEANGILRFDLKSQATEPLVGPHDSWVRAIAITPDGELTISGGYDGRLVWWPTAAEKPEPIRAIEAHQGWIRAVALSPDGGQLASCGNDLQIHLWDVASGELLKTFTGHESHVYNVAFSPSGDRLVSCDLKGFVKRWDLPAAATPEATDPAEAEAKPDAATEGEAAKPPTGGEELVHLEMLHKYDPTFRADIGGARCMAFSADGKRLAIGGITKVTNAFAGIGDAVVALVDMAERKLIVQYTPSKKVQGTAWGVAPHPAGFWIGLTGGGGGGWFYFWRGEEAGEFFQFKLKAVARGMSLSPDGTQIAVAHSDRHLRFYSLVPLPAAS